MGTQERVDVSGVTAVTVAVALSLTGEFITAMLSNNSETKLVDRWARRKE